MTKPRILFLNPYFLPSRHGGGSVTALVSLVERFKEEFEITVATSDFDLGASAAYPHQEKQWAREHTGIEIEYLPRGWPAVPRMSTLLQRPWELVYLNSFLSPGFAALPLALRALRPGRWPVLLAPRGELMAGALATKRSRKLGYLRTLQGLGLLHGVHVQATSHAEAEELRLLGIRAVELVADLPPVTGMPPPVVEFAPGPLRVVFLSRIEVKKNLLFALRALAEVQKPVNLDIVGPVGNADYWATCQEAMARLPPAVRVRYLGPVDPPQVLATLSGYEVFLFPTLGENNGYVIHEALIAGCIPLISDQTPWRGLAQAEVGADMQLQLGAFAAALAELADQSAAQRRARREKAQAYGLERLLASAQVDAMRSLFKKLTAQGRGSGP